MMELITIALILTVGACEAAFVYDHMEMVLQWPPTFCGTRNTQCKPAFLSQLNFSIHGLWPADATGNSSQNCPPPPNLNTVKQVWKNDRYLRKDLDEYWPDLKAGGDNESFWVHEWKVHGYCTNGIVPAVDYFQGAMAFAKKHTMRSMMLSLKEGGIVPTNHMAYKVEYMKTLIAGKVLLHTNYNVYISCREANASYSFLHEIHFCLDRKLTGFISCPADHRIRGCGGPNQLTNLVFPTIIN